jgi:hypothetical protein
VDERYRRSPRFEGLGCHFRAGRVGELWDSEAAGHSAKGVQRVERTSYAPEGARTEVPNLRTTPFKSGLTQYVRRTYDGLCQSQSL